MKDPHVGVFVQELQSHPVPVVGAVKRPGVFQIRGTKTVLELLSMAEGLADDAGDTVLVMRGISASESIGRDNAEQESQKDGQVSTTTGDAGVASKPAGLPSRNANPKSWRSTSRA